MIEKRGGAFEYEDNYKNCKKRKEKEFHFIYPPISRKFLRNFFLILIFQSFSRIVHFLFFFCVVFLPWREGWYSRYFTKHADSTRFLPSIKIGIGMHISKYIPVLWIVHSFSNNRNAQAFYYYSDIRKGDWSFSNYESMKRVNRITSIRIFVSSLETLEQDSFNERGGREGKKATPSLAKRKNSWKNSNKIRESSFANINLFRNDITHTRARHCTYVYM